MRTHRIFGKDDVTWLLAMIGKDKHRNKHFLDSRQFLFGYIVLEAMCLGLPCISTKVSGAVDLIRTGENGILVDLDDHEQLAGALCNLIDNKFNQQVIGKNATQLYDLLHIDSISKQWVEYIDSIMYK